MSGGSGGKLPPEHSQFKPGQSGNPKGRPRKRKLVDEPKHPLEVISEKTFRSRINGDDRELTAKEALQVKLFNAAMQGDRKAIRQVFGWIKKRREYFENKRKKHAPCGVDFVLEAANPRNADEALKLLDIITDDDRMSANSDDETLSVDDGGISCREENHHHVMQPWVVETALSRRRGIKRVSQNALSFLLAYTRDGASVRLPRGYKNER